MLDRLTHDLWLREAALGRPPPLDQVLRLQYGLDAPWHWRRHFFPIARAVRLGGPISRFVREVARGGGKTKFVNFLFLYIAEYVVPFFDVQPENKRLFMIGRDEDHVNNDLMDGLEKMMCEGAPWLKTDDWQAIMESRGQDGVLNLQVRSRTWNKDQFDLTNGVSIRGRSIRQTVRGQHGYLFAIDDLIEEKNYHLYSEEYADLIESSFKYAMEDGAVILVEGTPQGPRDTYEILGARESWDYVQLPGLDENGDHGYVKENRRAIKAGDIPDRDYTEADLSCLWPSRKGYKRTMADRGNSREEIVRWEREVMLRRLLEHGGLVHPDDLIAARDPTAYYVASALPGEEYGSGVDPSGLKKDAAAIATGVVDMDAVLHLRNLLTLEPRGPKAIDGEMEVIRALNDIADRFNNPSTMVESNGFQGIIAPLVSHLNPGISIKKTHLGAHKHGGTGWLLVRTFFHSRRVRLPWGPTPQEKALIEAGELLPEDIEAKRITRRIENQIRNISVVDGKVVTGKGEGDDIVSALYLLMLLAESMTSSILFAGMDLDAKSHLVTFSNSLNSSRRRRDPELDGMPNGRDPRIERAMRLERARHRRLV